MPFGIPEEPEIEQAAQGAALARDEHKARGSGHHSRQNAAMISQKKSLFLFLTFFASIDNIHKNN